MPKICNIHNTIGGLGNSIGKDREELSKVTGNNFRCKWNDGKYAKAHPFENAKLRFARQGQ